MKDIPLGIVAGEKIGDYFWCISDYFEGLWKGDLKTGRAYKEQEIPFMKDERFETAYIDVLSYRNYVILVPLSANLVYLYDIIRKEMIEIGLEQGRNSREVVLGGGAIIDKWLVVYPLKVQNGNVYLYRIDMETFEVNKEMILDKCDSNQFVFFDGGHFVCNEKMYLACSIADILLEIDVPEFSIRKIDYNSEKIGVCNVAVLGNKAYLFPVKSCSIIIVDLQNGRQKNIDDYPINYERATDRTVVDLIVHEGEIYAIPSYGNMVLKISGEKILAHHSLTAFMTEKVLSSECAYPVFPMIFCKAKKYEKDIFFISPCANAVYKYNLEDDSVQDYKMYVGDNEKRVWKLVENESIVKNLDSFIGHVCEV